MMPRVISKLRTAFVLPLRPIAAALLLAVFSSLWGGVFGTVAISSDLEKSELNKFEAGTWEDEDDNEPYLLVSEVYPSSDDSEFVEIYNPTAKDVDLFSNEIKIGDAEVKGKHEGMFLFSNPAVIKSHDFVIVAKSASAFEAKFQKKPNFEFSNTESDVFDMVKYTTWSSYSFNLDVDNDEVLLLDEDDNLVDGVVYGDGSLSGTTPHNKPTSGLSLQRVPVDKDTNDCSVDFMAGTPTPGM